MKALTALTVLVAAMTPAWAASDPVSPIEALSTNGCRPIIGTVISVHSDPARFETDVVLGDILPSSANRGLRPDGTMIALIPADDMKVFPALDTYVGQKVAIWSGGVPITIPSQLRITTPSQLQLISVALADPKKTWCYHRRFQLG